MNNTSSTQLAIIGAGPGGFTAAFLAADNGLKVTLIDAEPRIGGTCLHEGCIPSKTLLSLVKTIDQAKAAERSGVRFGAPQINLDEVNTFKKGVISKLAGGLQQLCKQKKVEFINGTANFVDSETLAIKKPDGSNQQLTFKKCIIATGSQPMTLPFIPASSKHVMFSSEALELKKIPETLLIVGGGYIGLEMATIYAGLGAKVTICEITENLLGGTDADLVTILLRTLKKKIPDIKLSTAIKEVASFDNDVEVTFNCAGNITKQRFEKILVAAGRKPNLSSLHLEKTKVRVLNNGFVKVKKGRQTDDKNIYAIGDVAPGPMLAHKASFDANAAVHHIARRKFDDGEAMIPAIAFTDPEIAFCGLSETQAQKKNIKIKVIKFPWAANGRAASLGRNDGVTKFIFNARGGKLLGVGIVGPEAGELIAQALLALKTNVPTEKLSSSVYPHPTLSETFKECLDLSAGKSFYPSR